MMDNKDLEAEIHPLKNEDKKSQENPGNLPRNEDNLKSKPVPSRLSRCRTVAFFLSLFTCLFVVFVLSFIIPCPDRPSSQGTWKLDYNNAVMYDFLALGDINKDKVQDVLFLYKNTNSSNNLTRSCADEGFSTPCAFVVAVSGANGSVLWERPVAQDVALVKCAMPQTLDSDEVSSACIVVGRAGSFVAVSFFTGETLWSHPSSFSGNVSILSPLLQVPDIDGDGDGTPDLLILAQEGQEVSGALYSGSTGYQIGHRGSLGVDGDGVALLHVTRTGAQYILLPIPCPPSKVSLRGPLIWSSKAPWAGLGKAAHRRLIYHFLPPYPLPGKPPLCAVLLPSPSQASLAFPISALSLRGHETQGCSWNLRLGSCFPTAEGSMSPGKRATLSLTRASGCEGFPDCTLSQSFASVHCPCTLAQRARLFPYSGAYLMAVSPCALFVVPEAQGQQSSFAQITSIAL